MKVVLASGSPRRRELLRDLGLRFDVRAPNVDETRKSGESARRYVARLAKEKHTAVAERYLKCVIVAADTIVVLGSRILGKPRNRNEARRMLRALSGKTHRVLTAVCVGHAGNARVKVATTFVRFRPLSPEQIAKYLRSGESMDKAGAYGAQGRGRVLIASIRGSYTNVIGLPVAETVKLLVQAGVKC